MHFIISLFYNHKSNSNKIIFLAARYNLSIPLFLSKYSEKNIPKINMCKFHSSLSYVNYFSIL